MSEKLCLQWSDFQENIKGAFKNFREDKNFNDVTLVCEALSWTKLSCQISDIFGSVLDGGELLWVRK